ncbi:hypothetical protein Ancab_017988 [Ancistrocladus abbreviatus]
MEEASKKRQADESPENCSSIKKPKPPDLLQTTVLTVGDCDDFFAGWSTDDETVKELMELLDPEHQPQATAPFKVKFISYPYSAPLIYETSSTSYMITINGNEESCGSSFSDSDSSIMASVDMGGFSIVNPQSIFGFNDGESGGAWGSIEEMPRSHAVADGEESVGGGDKKRGWDEIENECDVWDWMDEEALAKFVGEEFVREENQKM